MYVWEVQSVPFFNISLPSLLPLQADDLGLHCPGEREGMIKMQASFHVLINHLYLFCGEMSFQVFCWFFNWAGCLLLNSS